MPDCDRPPDTSMATTPSSPAPNASWMSSGQHAPPHGNEVAPASSLLPVERAPLAFALPATVRTTDWVDIAIVYPDRQGRITGLLPSPDHRGVFQSAMTPDDVVVFRTYDNQGAPVVPHTAIDLVDAPAGPPRQSRETRILVRYA